MRAFSTKHIKFLPMLPCIFMLAVVCILAVGPALAGDTTSTGCAKDIVAPSNETGKNLAKGIFDIINAMLLAVGNSMYVSIVKNSFFQNFIISVSVLYVAIYGMMIAFNMVSHRTPEVLARLTRIAVFYGLLASSGAGFANDGWLLFNKYIGQLFIGGMNELIYDFTLAANPVGKEINFTPPPPGYITFLDINALTSFYPSMQQVLHPSYLISVIGLLFLGPAGAPVAMALGWAFINYFLLILGVLITYVRSIVGLAFLFGIAPLFIAFLLFHKTRTAFGAWLNKVISLAITPVMLFAYITFFASLLDLGLFNMFASVDWCWTKFTKIAGMPFDIGFWRPKVCDATTGICTLWGGEWENADNSAKGLPGGLNTVNILFFLTVTHLGKEFSKHVESIAQHLSNGIGPGSISSGEVSGWIKQNFGKDSSFGNVFGNRRPTVPDKPTLTPPPPRGTLNA